MSVIVVGAKDWSYVEMDLFTWADFVEGFVCEFGIFLLPHC